MNFNYLQNNYQVFVIFEAFDKILILGLGHAPRTNCIQFSSINHTRNSTIQDRRFL